MRSSDRKGIPHQPQDMTHWRPASWRSSNTGKRLRPYDRTVVSSSFQMDLSILDKTLEFPPGSWLLSSYTATGLDNVPIFVRADNSEDVLRAYLESLE